jgi:hypothetical protein
VELTEERLEPARLTVLGPQRQPTVDTVAAELDSDLPLATVTAGWQEREPDDEELDQLLGGRSVNLHLYGRWLDITERDPEYAVAAVDHRAFVDELRLLHLVQLDFALTALHNLAGRSGDSPPAIAAAMADAEEAVRLTDERHAGRVSDANAAFETAYPIDGHDVVREHIEAVHAILAQAGALFVAGGHVGALLRLLRMFRVVERIPPTVVAWSAGAMALTDRVVLFHDRTPQGPSPVEIYDNGLGLLHDVVLLPDGRRRLLTDDYARMAELARRLAPATCVILERGTRLDFDGDAASTGRLAPTAHVVAADGRISESGQA